MAGYAENLQQRVSGKEEERSIDKLTLDNEGKVLDITQQQWFWDQAVLS